MSAKTARPTVFSRYRARHIALAIVVVLLCAYYALRDVRSVADFASTYIAHTWQRLFGMIANAVPFSVAEVFCALVLIAALAYTIVTICRIVRKPDKLQRAYGAFITILTGVLTIFMLICWLWSISFYSHTFAELSGIEAPELSVEELKEVTLYFAEEANVAAEAVERDEEGLYVCDTQTIFSESPALYANLPEEFYFLPSSDLKPKPLLSSYLMSLSGFTGVFFPLTGEANINTHAPDCFIPSTVAHELAHQRGVAREQDANFTAVVVCAESEDANFKYSGALLAYIHLSNALRGASYEDWVAVSSSLGEDVRRDLVANNEYWAQLQTPIAEVSETVYEEFLYSQGQELGMRSYGACVDLLVAYYGDVARSR